MKIALVGCGRIAGAHLPFIVKGGRGRLVAVCDQNELRAMELAERWKVPHYNEISQMLYEARPDVVHILTPPQTHASLAIQALKAGSHILVEKPLCLTLDEADAIYASAQSAGRLVMVDHTFLWSPLVQRARQVVGSGRLGRVLNVYYVLGDDYLEMVKGGYARWALELRGGVFADLIPHQLYLLRAFLPGLRVVSARASGHGINNLHELRVEFAEDGAGANLWMSLNQRPLEHFLRIHCNQGILHLDLRNYHLAVVPERGLLGPAARLVNTLSESWQGGLGTIRSALGLVLGGFNPRAGTAGAIQAFYQAVAEGQPSPVAPADAKAIVVLSNAVWDLLEHTPGALTLPVDSRGRKKLPKTPSDFIPRNAEEPAQVLVTGGTGFIGSHLVHRLVSVGRRVRVLTRKGSSLEALPANGVELVLGDVSDLNAVRCAMQGIKVVYHLAATMGGDWADHKRGTVNGTRNVLAAAAEAGVPNVVYLSSLGVLYASRFPRWRAIDETFPVEQKPRERGDYSRAKLEAEQLALEYAKNGKPAVCIIRPGLVYGPGRREFLSDAGFRVSNGMALVVGLGWRKLGLTYVENLVDALLLAEKSGNSWGRIFNIVDPDPPTVRDYIKRFRREAKTGLAAIYIPVLVWTVGFGLLDVVLRLTRGRSSHLCYRLRSMSRGPKYDTSLKRDELDAVARVSFAEGMKRTYREEPVP